MEANLHKQRYFRACRRQSAFEHEKVHNLNNSRSSALPMIMIFYIFFLTLKHQRRSLSSQDNYKDDSFLGFYVQISKYILVLKNQATNQVSEHYLEDTMYMAEYYIKQDSYDSDFTSCECWSNPAVDISTVLVVISWQKRP